MTEAINYKHLFDNMCWALDAHVSLLKRMRYPNSNYIPKEDGDHFHFIPMGSYLAAENLFKAYNILKDGTSHTPKFLDAGCGVGNIMILAMGIGFDVWGIERDPKIVEIARGLMSHSNNDCKRGKGIIKADITKFRRYSEFDVIYYYQPMYSAKMVVFENAVKNQAKIGAIIIPFGSGYFENAEMNRYGVLNPKKDKRFKRISHHIYQRKE